MASVGWALAHLGRLATRADDPAAVGDALSTLAFFEAARSTPPSCWPLPCTRAS
ncbi:hypothetical protein [Actinoplanes regularis]|uniref:Uncharacterized protein n=1 Tax=Actinoplanes regularis TaxID=52697 RepID=A0A239A661_9ACTN|nr:hypothetical protein [Actinoplanes regularis]SNR90578.1 hypothetical protein SAMN06264365_10765 [Actinoplanes regularis]